MGTGVQLLSKEKCCGVPLIANGFTDKARKQAISNVESLREAIAVKGIPVIATSSTCTFALRDEYPEVLDGTTPGCANISSWPPAGYGANWMQGKRCRLILCR